MLTQDEQTGAGRARVVDAVRNRGLVVYRSDFDAGFDNWTDHWDGFRPWPIISLTNHASVVGGRSLMLSTSEGAHVANSVGNATAAFRRMAIYNDMRYHSVSAFLGIGSGGYSGAWQSFDLMIDTQSYDNAVRSFFKLRCALRPSPDFSRWEIEPDNNNTPIVIPGSTHTKPGDNDNKVNFQYARLTIDRDANGGLGGYHEAQIGPNVYDLTGLGGGSALEPPQTTGDAIAEFNGGFNIGLGLVRSIEPGGCQLFADDIAYTVSATA